MGPTCEGEITESYTSRLKQIGEWLEVNGEAIYECSGTVWGTEFGEYKQVDDKRKFVVFPAVWRCTSKDDNIYIHVLEFPKDGKITLPALKDRIVSSHILGFDDKKLNVKQNTDNILLSLPIVEFRLPIVVCLKVKK